VGPNLWLRGVGAWPPCRPFEPPLLTGRPVWYGKCGVAHCTSTAVISETVQAIRVHVALTQRQMSFLFIVIWACNALIPWVSLWQVQTQTNPHAISVVRVLNGLNLRENATKKTQKILAALGGLQALLVELHIIWAYTMWILSIRISTWCCTFSLHSWIIVSIITWLR